MKNLMFILFVVILTNLSVGQNYLYSHSSTHNTWSLTLGGINCGCTPTTTDTVEIHHNWANPSYYPLTSPFNLAFGNYLSINPFKVIVGTGGVVYQSGTIPTGMVLQVEDGGFWGFNGSVVTHGGDPNTISLIHNKGTILANGSFTNKINIVSPGEFCKNGSWLNDITVDATLNNIGDANMDPYFNVYKFGAWCSGLTTLPVELVNFNINEDNVLTWVTASEVNTMEFIIEKSNDGLYFTEVGSVAAVGNSDDMNIYTFKVTNSKPINYFRLKILDIDGYYEYSDLTTNTRVDGTHILQGFELYNLNAELVYKSTNSYIPYHKMTLKSGLYILRIGNLYRKIML